MRKSVSNLWAEFRAFAFKGNMIDLAVAVVIGAAFSGVIDSLVKDIIMPAISYATTAVKEAKTAAADVAAKATVAVGITTQPATQPATAPSTAAAAAATPATGPAATPEAVAIARAAASTRPATGPADPESPRSADQVADSMIAAAAGDKSKEWREMTSAFATALAADRKAADEKAAAEKLVAEKKAADEKPVDFAWKLGRLNVGNFLAAILNFMIIAGAVFVIIVKLLGGVMKRAGGTPKPGEPTTKECPECLSVIPVKARRCANCTAVLVPPSTPTVTN